MRGAEPAAKPIRTGCARCSIAQQEFQRQLDALARAKCRRVSSEKINTRARTRPKLEEALKPAYDIREAARTRRASSASTSSSASPPGSDPELMERLERQILASATDDVLQTPVEQAPAALDRSAADPTSHRPEERFNRAALLCGSATLVLLGFGGTPPGALRSVS